jgi:hypothetical protein
MSAGAKRIRRPRRDKTGAPLPPTHYIFNHIPKTGGISLLAVCGQNLEPSEICPHLAEHDIRLMPAARFEHYRFIAGHFSVLTQARFCRSRHSITLLRDPIRRIFSAYIFWRSAAENNPVTSKAKELSFTDFVRYFIDSPAIIHNPYTHHLAGIGRDCPAYPADEANLLAAAKHNLAAFNFVGICEEMQRSALLLCHELGWPAPTTVPHENRTSAAALFGGIEPQTMGILRDRNHLDLELYAYAAQLFHAREEAAAKSATGSQRPVEPNRFAPYPVPYKMDARARIASVSAAWVPDDSSRMLEIAVDFTTTAKIAELSLGIQVNDAAGNIVWGTSTSRECLELAYEIDRDCRAVLLVECELPRGMYFVTVALSEPRRLGFHEHWIDHAALFTVEPPRVGRSRYVRGMRSQEFRSTVTRNVNGQ